ncbi:MAG: GNAT family N-acetyltransferase [Bacteroidales bacterium]|nr:GNAT family N-acetyltransferase [Bacteroidales bacterium]
MQLTIKTSGGTFLIRPICRDDNAAIRDIILETLIEHGAVGGGFASGDQDTQHMYEAFLREGRVYYVIEKTGSDAPHLILGGAGIAPLPGEPGTCELVKMYFRPEIRGLGLGKKLLSICLEEAAKAGYSQIYLETLEQMQAARGLYEHLGFKRITCHMGSTGHYACDVFYLRKL